MSRGADAGGRDLTVSDGLAASGPPRSFLQRRDADAEPYDATGGARDPVEQCVHGSRRDRLAVRLP